ncbi:TetR/AcrR family transcriptional regulator [Sphingopyxis sp. MWB1]|uniref:TetR/AcrR family transcriptional regulator n=1 Tax=Sphingopyxis sp. MWB1 TaxID=1537715 RepID=UPI000B1085CD|nr:TetR/AcrR family transcriptional regulator [Sphingopyxis sp. MWB1]
MFNRHGFDRVTIDQIMAEAGLTRGGFYNHFRNKEQLYAEAVASFLMGRGAIWRTEAGVEGETPAPQIAVQMIESYLSDRHLGDLDGQCPMIALSSDVARAHAEVGEAYQMLLDAMVGLFEQCLADRGEGARREALSLALLCVGGMILARSLPQSALAAEIRGAAQEEALRRLKG